MELLYITLTIIFSMALGCYMAYHWMKDEIKYIKTLRYGDLKGIIIRNEIIEKRKQEIKELKRQLALLQSQNSNKEDSNKSNIND